MTHPNDVVHIYDYTLDPAGHRSLTNETISADPNGINGALSYSYDAVGNRTQLTSTLAPIPAGLWGFAGEQFDPNLNLYYNRARYLATTTGRFWSMDTDEGDDNDPLSLHKYLYTEADPVDSRDPSGNQIDDLLGGVEASMALGTMPTLNFMQAVLAALPIPPYPTTLEGRQLVGVVYAESSTPSYGGGEFADEKLAIAETFTNEAYYATVSKYNSSYGNGTIWSAIQNNSLAVQINNAEWRQVMTGRTSTSDLRDPSILSQVLSDRAARVHFIDSVLAVNVLSGTDYRGPLAFPLSEIGPQALLTLINHSTNLQTVEDAMKRWAALGQRRFMRLNPIGRSNENDTPCASIRCKVARRARMLSVDDCGSTLRSKHPR